MKDYGHVVSLAQPVHLHGTRAQQRSPPGPTVLNAVAWFLL